MTDNVSATSYECGDFTIRLATRELLHAGNPVEVEGKVFDLIALLVENRERALGKQEIIEALWGHRPITDAALSQLIYKARRACHDDGERQAVIRTIYGRGLQWIAPVRATIAEPGSPARPHDAQPPTAEASSAPPSPAARNRRRWWLPATAALLVVFTVGAWWLIPRGVAHDAPALPRVALVPIENATGDASLDWTSRGIPGLIGSLLDRSRGIDVIDPLRVSRAWEFTPGKGEDRAGHTRKVTNATILVAGKLRKVSDLYELALHVDPGPGRAATDIALTGTEPGALAVAALPRLRNALSLQPDITKTDGPAPEDAYLAQTFARGMDAATHGRWADASPYFALVAKGDPGFLPGRYRLGQAQLRTGQADAAEAMLKAVQADAERSGAPDLAALALDELAYRSMLRHAFADAVKFITLAAPLAERARNPEIQVDLAIHAAQAQASLKHNEAAAAATDKARALIERYHLIQLRPALHQAEIFAADSRSDYAALERAARARLAANQTVGDERGSMVSLYNIAYAMENQNRRIDALPLWAQVWTWARDHQDYDLQAGAAWYLASTLFNGGLTGRATRINDWVLDVARQHGDRLQQSLALQVRAGIDWTRGDDVAALRSARAAGALIDAANDPSSQLNAWTPEAFIAVATEPATAVAIADRADALIGTQPNPGAHRFRQQVLHALRAATRGDRTAAHTALESALAAAGGESEVIEARQIALRVALVTGDADSAAIGLRDLDLDRTVDSLLLQLAASWARHDHDTALAQRVARRQTTLLDGANQALRQAGLETALALAPASR